MAASLMLRTIVALVALLPGVAAADVWQADQHAGALRFIATQAGARFPGHFGKFKVRLDFDPAEPAQGRLEVTIAMSSADTATPSATRCCTGAISSGFRDSRRPGIAPKDSSATATAGWLPAR